jgi:hypothetical protein
MPFRGFKKAKGYKLIFIDADVDPQPEFLRSVKLGKYVARSRFTRTTSGLQRTSRFLQKNYPHLLNHLLRHFSLGIGGGRQAQRFKGYKNCCAKKTFPSLHSRRWVFDIELLYKIKKEGYSLCRQPVRWTHKKDSKMKLLDPLKITFELIALRRHLAAGKNGAGGSTK